MSIPKEYTLLNASKFITNIIKGPDGAYWIVTNKMGLFRYYEPTGTWTLYRDKQGVAGNLGTMLLKQPAIDANNNL